MTVLHIKDLLGVAFKQIEDKYNQPSGLLGISTGYGDLDDNISGLQKGEFILLAARPAIGKTALALNIALNVAQNENQSVIIFPLSQSKENIIKRLLFLIGKIELSKFITRRMDENDWNKLADAKNILADLPIFIDGTALMNIENLTEKCLNFNDAGLVLIDNIKDLEECTPSETEKVLPKISYELKNLAKKINAPILALFALSYSEDSEAPTLADLREVGSPHKFADVVLILHREDFYNGTRKEEGKAQIIIAQNKVTDSCGIVELLYNHRYLKFKNTVS